MCRSPSCRPVSSLSHARQAALCAAAGHLQQEATGITAALVAVQALRRHAVPHAQVYDYVPGHLGMVPNEIADVLSKIAASADAPTCGLQVPDYTALWLLCLTECLQSSVASKAINPVAHKLDEGAKSSTHQIYH